MKWQILPKASGKESCQGSARELGIHHGTAASSSGASRHVMADSPGGADGRGKLSAFDGDQTGCLLKKTYFTLFRDTAVPCLVSHCTPPLRELVVHRAGFTHFKESCLHPLLQ